MKIAIVGSRTYPDLNKVVEYVKALPEGTTIVSGGALGPDLVAEKAAKRRGLPTLIFLADWKAEPKEAGAIRNQTIVDHADEVVAFWDGISKGTAITIRKAKAAGKPVTIIKPT